MAEHLYGKVQALLDKLQRLLLEQAQTQLPNATSILDIGCYQGRFLAHVALLYPKAKLTGIDISEKRIQRAHRGATAQLRFQVVSVEQTSFDDESFDLIFACRTMHHWGNKQQGLREVARLLTSDGLFLLGDPFIEGPLRHNWFNWLMEKLDGGRFTHPKDLKHMLSEAGLQVIEKTAVPYSGKMLSVCVITKM